MTVSSVCSNTAGESREKTPTFRGPLPRWEIRLLFLNALPNHLSRRKNAGAEPTSADRRGRREATHVALSAVSVGAAAAIVMRTENRDPVGTVDLRDE